MLQSNFNNILSRDLSSKTLPCGQSIPNLKDELKKYFLMTYNLYQKLFSIIKSQKSYYTKPQPLRHPLIFYFGHTAAFFINKLIDRGLISQRINQSYQRMFAVGVDEMDWDDLNQSHYQWPSLSLAKQFRNKVKKLVIDLIDKCEENQITWTSDLWIIMMGIQHQRIHLETSAVIIRRLPIDQVTQPEWMKQCPHMEKQITKVPLNGLEKVPALLKQWNRQKENSKTYGWDNQFGHKTIHVQEYNASKMLVSNAEFYQFLIDNGYQKLQYWTDQGKNWLKSKKVNKPVFWQISYENAQKPQFKLRTITNIIQMPWDWPVQVNNLQAQAFCQWKSQKQGKKLRLPTQDQYYALRNILNIDFNDWKQRSVGNINFQYWLSPNPVNMFQTQGFYDIVGNVWQHTVTPIYPFEGFEIHPNYDDFTTPTFDNRHNIIKGGSFISTGNEALYHARYAFRRHFYQFAGFRYVQSNNSTQVQSAQIDQSDQSVEKALQVHFVQNNSYINKILQFIDSNISPKTTRSAAIGCSVGRLPLQLAKRFKHSYGTDYTARYFQMATRLLQQHVLNYRQIQIQLSKLNLTPQILNNVHLYQMNPENLDHKKINQIEFMVIDGFSIRPNTIKKVVKNSVKLLAKKQEKVSMLIVIDYEKNNIENIEEIMKKNCAEFKISFENHVELFCSSQENKKIGKLQYITLQCIL